VFFSELLRKGQQRSRPSIRATMSQAERRFFQQRQSGAPASLASHENERLRGALFVGCWNNPPLGQRGDSALGSSELGQMTGSILLASQGLGCATKSSFGIPDRVTVKSADPAILNRVQFQTRSFAGPRPTRAGWMRRL
jgi:hypothetical protein